MKKINQRNIPKSEGKLYLSKATDFYKSMQMNIKEKNWNAVGLSGIHCAISSCDAILAQLFGIRHTSPDHKASADLLRSKVQTAESKKNSERLKRILEKKNLNEYLSRSFTQEDANNIHRDVERFYTWTREILN